MYRVSLFISHSWLYSDHYNSLCRWIFGEPWNYNGTPITFLNHSVPKEHPIHYAPTDWQLRDAIYDRIIQSDVVVIPTGMYANYSKWIGKEIEGAQIFGKPILAVNPWAQERNSSVVQMAANETVGWNKQSVINGIWRLSPKQVAFA
jgi:hypothetical protein